MSTITKPTFDFNIFFDGVLDVCRRTSVWSEPSNPSDPTIELIRRAFESMFTPSPKTTTGWRIKKTTKPWNGFRRDVIKDGKRYSVTDRKSLWDCFEGAFHTLYLYHAGKRSAYLGTIINATQHLELCAEYLRDPLDASKRPIPFPAQVIIPYGSPDSNDEQRKANKRAARSFADRCDTFCQCLVHVLTDGATSSVNGDVWAKALGGVK